MRSVASWVHVMPCQLILCPTSPTGFSLRLRVYVQCLMQIRPKFCYLFADTSPFLTKSRGSVPPDGCFEHIGKKKGPVQSGHAYIVFIERRVEHAPSEPHAVILSEAQSAVYSPLCITIRGLIPNIFSFSTSLANNFFPPPTGTVHIPFHIPALS